jgi:hypothetical protein
MTPAMLTKLARRTRTYRYGNQRGEVVGVVLIFAAVLAATLAATVVAITTSQRADLNTCIDRVLTANYNLKAKYPQGALVPVDDPDVQAIQGCRKLLQDISSSPAVMNASALKNLRPLVEQGLQNVGTCHIADIVPRGAQAGLTGTVAVFVTFPYASGQQTATATTTVHGVSQTIQMSKQGLGFHGHFNFSEAASREAGGEVSAVTVNASSVMPPQADGTCVPPWSLQGGQCVVSCAPTGTFTWFAPPTPSIDFFVATPLTIDRARPTQVVLTWETRFAASVEIDSGVGPVDDSGTAFLRSPDQKTTYKLTARGVRLEDTKIATRTVEVVDSSQLAVTLTSPGGNSTVTTTSVPVTGKVSPVPSTPGSMTAAISVNGAPVKSILVDAAGNFATTVTLAKVTTLGDLVVANPGNSVNSCGDKSRTVTVSNNATDVSNTIGVTVSDGPRTGSASATVAHAVQVTQFIVTWTSCAPLDKNEAVGVTLAAGQSQAVGTVECGCKHAPGGCHASCGVRASVDTSIGGKIANATWTFNVDGPCP